MPANDFHAWLASRGHDASELDVDRLTQFRRFFEQEQETPILTSCPDATGNEINLGDAVRVPYRVTGIHPVLGPDGTYQSGLFDLNLSQDGMHAISVRNTKVRKA